MARKRRIEGHLGRRAGWGVKEEKGVRPKPSDPSPHYLKAFA